MVKYANDKDKLLYISEIYYNKKGKPTSYIKPQDLFNTGLFGDNIKELKGQLKLMKGCLKKPIITIGEGAMKQ